MAGKLDLLDNEWCELVFEDRNKQYGAYQLRKEYSKNTVYGIIFAIVFFTLSISAPLIVNLLSSIAGDDEKLKVTEVTTLEEPPPIDKNEPPPPPVEPPPPLKSTVKFTPPEIKPDEELKDEEPPPTQEELKEVDAGTKTEEGDPEGIDKSLLGDGNEVIDEAPSQIFLIVEQMPEFPGGEEKLFDYLRKNIVYPPMAKDAGISGTVHVTFEIDQTGTVKDVKIVRGVRGLDDEAIRVVKSMPPWKPGKQGGVPVRVQFGLPIRFSLR